jgi:hypothetical protein
MKFKFFLVLIMLNALCLLAMGQVNETTFGSSTADPTSLRGDIYYIPEGTASLPDFSTLTPVGSIYTKVLDVPEKSFDSGFPGVTDRFEWFAIMYTGTFQVENEGEYKFRLVSDDGSRLFIDGKKIIDDDGIHSTQSASGSVSLGKGVHQIEVDYFQGPRYSVALQLFWTPPGGTETISNPQFVNGSSLPLPNYLPEGTSSLPDSSSLTDLKWQGMNEDKVGEWDSGLPDERNDGHFLLNLSLPRQIEIKSIAIYSADANGTHVGGQVWDTAATNYWILGVFYQGNQLDQHHVSSLGSFSGNVQFDLYGDDSGWFKSGNWFEVEVILGDGTKLTKLISISSNVDLTGVWSCDDGGTYYIRQSGDSIWWFGEPSTNPGAWSNVANGTIRDSIINIFWSDVPKGCTMNKGTLVLSILSKDKLTATDKTGGFGGSNWARIAMNTCPGSTNTGQGPTTTGPGPTTTIPSTTTNTGSTIVTPGNQGALNPWDDTSVRPLIDEWIRQQDNCLKKVYGSGAFIDQWGRACGNLGNTSISCSLTPDHPADWDSYHYLWANNWCPMYYPYTVQSYVKYRQTGNSFDSMAKCKGAGESCIA